MNIKIEYNGNFSEIADIYNYVQNCYWHEIKARINGFTGMITNYSFRKNCNKRPYDDNCKLGIEMLICNEVDTEEDKIHNLEINKDATLFDMMAKFNEEIKEVYEAINKLDEENFIEELLDVVQVCYGLAYTQNINLDDYIKQHNEKLLSRGHEFID